MRPFLPPSDARHFDPVPEPVDHFEFSFSTGPSGNSARANPGQLFALNPFETNGRPEDPGGGGGSGGPTPSADQDPDPAPDPIVPSTPPEAPTEIGRNPEAVPGTPETTPLSPAPGDDNASYGRPDDAAPDLPPDTGPVASYTSGGLAATSYNITVEFVGSWTTALQEAFIEATEYLSAIILMDLPNFPVDGTMIDDLTITATLEGIDGVGGVLGSAGPRAIRTDGSNLPATGAMRFDIADAENLLSQGQWDSVVLHEILHTMGFGTLWSVMGLTTGSVAGGDMRFTGAFAVSVYQTAFPSIAGADPGSHLGIPVETDGGPGTAGGHWDEALFDTEFMTGYNDDTNFVSVMTIAALEDMGYDTVLDDPFNPADLYGLLPGDPLADLIA